MTPAEKSAVLRGRLCQRCGVGLRFGPELCATPRCPFGLRANIVSVGPLGTWPRAVMRRTAIAMGHHLFGHLPAYVGDIWAWVEGP